MKTHTRLMYPVDVEIQVHFTLPLNELKRLAEQQNASVYPSSAFKSSLLAAIAAAEKSYIGDTESRQ